MEKYPEEKHPDEAAITPAVVEFGETLNMATVAADEEHAQSKWEAVKAQPAATMWAVFVFLIICLEGFDYQAGGSVLGIQKFREDYGYAFEGNYVLPAKWQSAFTGAPVVFTILGSLISTQLADRIGRRWTIVIGICNSFIGTGLEFASTSLPLFFGGKLLNGLTIGCLSTVAVSYMSEITPLALRGMATASCNLALNIGPLICTIVNNSYASLPNHWAYRSIFVAQWSFAALILPLAVFLPESPWYLVTKGKYDQAAKSLVRLGMKKDNLDGYLAQMKLTKEYADMETQQASYLECFRGVNRRRTILTVMPFIIQVVCGTDFVGSYSTYYYELAGNSVGRAFQLACGGTALSAFGTICSWAIIDRFGRRPLLFYGLICLTIVLFLSGGLACSTKAGPLQGVVGLFMLYGFVYNLVMGGVAYTVITELPTNRLRTRSISISFILSQALNGATGFVLPYIFNPGYGNLQAKTSFIYGGASVFCCVYLYFCHPETAHRSFMEIDEMFFKKVPARQFKGYVCNATTEEHKEPRTQEEAIRAVTLADEHPPIVPGHS